MKKLREELENRMEECIKLRLYVSWRTNLEVAYEIASEKKQYNRCYLINELIREDINSQY